MRCEHVQRALNALLDREADLWTRWRVTRHVGRCLTCAAAYEETQRVGDQARSWRQVTAPPALQDRIAAALAAAPSLEEEAPSNGLISHRSKRDRIWRYTVRWGWVATMAVVMVALWLGNRRGGDVLAATIRATAAAPAIHMIARGSQGSYAEAWFVVQVGGFMQSRWPDKDLIVVDDLKHKYEYAVRARHVEILPSELAKGKSPLDEIPTGAEALKKLQARQWSGNVIVKTIVRNGRRLRQISAAGDPEVFTIDPQTDRLMVLETGGLPNSGQERLRIEFDYPDPATVDRARFRFQIPPGVTVSTQSESSLACTSRIKHLALAFRMYSLDYDDRLPPIKTAAQVKGPLTPYVMPSERPTLFVCPVTRASYQPNAALSGKLYTKVSKDTPLLWDSRPHADGLRTVGYPDDRVERKKQAPGSKE